jgi:predicted branched-subunit amino acid permease
MTDGNSSIRTGMRAALPLAPPTLVLGISFGVLARPQLGAAAPIVMSALVFSGGAQFAALSVLSAGGGIVAATLAAVMMNTRWLPMSFALAPSLRGGRARRIAESQAIVDASFIMASRDDGSFDRGMLIGATLPQATAWTAGTVIGVLSSNLIHNPDALGLSAIFPAFYLALLVRELRDSDDSRPRLAAILAIAITLPLMLIAPPGLPVLAAAAAALIGLRSTR